MINLNSDSLKKFKLNLLPGSYLFAQDADADSVFFIISGFVVLCNGEWENETFVNYVGPGEVLGEHLFFGIKNMKRVYAAKANTEVQCIRMTADEIEKLKTSDSPLYAELLKLCGKTSYQRLIRANQLIHCFKYEKKEDRLMHLMVYLFDTFGKKTERGLEIYLPSSLFKFYIQMSKEEFRFCLMELEKSEIIKAVGNDIYLLQNRLAMMQKLPKIVDELPSFPII
ncbi:MAG: Crp/Fnr family transcriptional regulator [Deltaproteobacteria bacterium]